MFCIEIYISYDQIIFGVIIMFFNLELNIKSHLASATSAMNKNQGHLSRECT
jgi:hypothetical protein